MSEDGGVEECSLEPCHTPLLRFLILDFLMNLWKCDSEE